MSADDARALQAFSEEAVARHLHGATVPIITDDGNSADMIGCGTFYAHDGRHFFVTASHVVDGKQPLETLGFPLERLTGGGGITFGRSRLLTTDAAVYDVAVWELLEQSVIDTVRASSELRFLTDADVDSRTSPTGPFVLAGYRGANASVDPKTRTIAARPTFISTERYEGSTEDIGN